MKVQVAVAALNESRKWAKPWLGKPVCGLQKRSCLAQLTIHKPQLLE